MYQTPTVIFDADDTLWHNMNLFVDTHQRYAGLLQPYFTDIEALELRLNETERKNIKHFGYGIKGFTLSMIETALEVTQGRVGGDTIQAIIDLGREMLGAPVELMPQMAETIETLAQQYPLGVITKGDLLNQETKFARSGLSAAFKFFEVVSEKDAATYLRVLQRHGLEPEGIIMVGNSLKSDIGPILTLGGRAVHIPYEVTWVHEHMELSVETTGSDRFKVIDSVAHLPTLLSDW